MKQLTETKLQLAIGRTLTQGQISLSKFGKGNVKKHCSKLMFKASYYQRFAKILPTTLFELLLYFISYKH